MRQLVTIGADGSITSLQTKRDQGLDLRKFGQAEISRTSLIEWVEHKQAWQIRFLKRGQFKGVVDAVLFAKASGCPAADGFYTYKEPASLFEKVVSLWRFTFRRKLVPLWKDYEDAVLVEIALVQSLRRSHGAGCV
jgi:hypothetical protein